MANGEQIGDTHQEIRQQKETLIVRLATKKDADALFVLLISSMEMYRRNAGIPIGMLDALTETKEDLLRQISSVPVFVALDATERLVGSVRMIRKYLGDFHMAGAYGFSDLSPDTEVGYFSRFAVLPESHNLGIGGLLYKAAEKDAREKGFPYIFLHTSTANKDLVAFYERRGFSLIGTDQSRGYTRGFFVKKL